MLAQYTDVWIATFNEAEARKLAANPDLTFLTSTQLLSLINNQHQHNKIVNSLEYLVEEFPPLPEKEKVNFFLLKSLFSLNLINKEAMRKRPFVFCSASSSKNGTSGITFIIKRTELERWLGPPYTNKVKQCKIVLSFKVNFQFIQT